jgi:hypothetical protein
MTTPGHIKNILKRVFEQIEKACEERDNLKKENEKDSQEITR